MYYDKNIEILKEKHFDIYLKIRNVKLSEGYKVVYTPDKLPTLNVEINGKSIFLHSKYNPMNEAKLFIKDKVGENIDNYVVFGLGFGYHVQELINYIVENNYSSHIYIIETNVEIFKRAISELDFINIIENVNVDLFLTPTIQELNIVFSKLTNLENHKLVIHRPSLKVVKEEFNELKLMLEDYILLKDSANRYFSLMEENFKSNIKNCGENADVLFNQYKDIPLYMVSAGPSLDKNIGKLKNAKNKGIILSIGRAVRSLVQAGIQPDLIIITDPAEYLYDMQLKGIDIKVPIIVLSTCDKNVMQNYKGKKFVALQKGYALAEKLAQENNNILINTGGSVATTALDIAIKMGCNPIIFVGQDLAFTDNKTHAKDTYSKDIIQNKNLIEVEDINGNIVYTQKNLFAYLRWIKNRIKEEKYIVFIDATEGGAKIEGTLIQSLEETINKNYNEYIFKIK